MIERNIRARLKLAGQLLSAAIQAIVNGCAVIEIERAPT